GDLAATECLRDALAGLGGLEIEAGRNQEAQAEFRRVVALAERVAQRGPRRPDAQSGRIEAYLQLGRAHAFDGHRQEAEGWDRQTKNVAGEWTMAERGNVLARSLLASSYRKLADERKLVEDYPGARAYYRQAIATGREVLAADRNNVSYKYQLAVAID